MSAAAVFYALCVPMIVVCVVVAVIGARQDRARCRAADARLERRLQQVESDLNRFAGGAR